jgi:uncharacterized protein (TIGR03435 family)
LIVTPGLSLLLSLVISAQSPQKFEVAVIRPSVAPPGAGTSFNVFEGGRLRIVNEPVRLLIRVAFRLQNAQIAGGPGWLDTNRFDVEAKTGRPEKPTPDQLSPLMQDMLTERFHLKFHRETRELTVYVLMVAKKGPKLKLKAEDESTAMNTHGGQGMSQLIGTAVPIELLAGYVGNRLGRIVLDRTGLTGSYDFTLDWAPDQAPDSSAPSLVTALREQLGLRLESHRSPVEVLVIDSIDGPSEN